MAHAQHGRVLNTCETCRDRKVRCNKRHPTDAVCINCQRRGNQCIFRTMRQRRPHVTVQTEIEVPGSPAGPETASIERNDGNLVADFASPSPRPSQSLLRQDVESSHARQMPGELLIDRILCQDPTSSSEHGHSMVMASNDHVPSSTLAFFSEDKIRSLSNQLKHDRFYSLIHQIDSAVAARLKAFKDVPATSLMSGQVSSDDLINAPTYIQAYFENIHPLYPFLRRSQFEELAQRHAADESLRTDATWSALYHGVLCLGSMCCDEGSFLQAQGTSWKFFTVALKLVPELLLVRRTLRTAQALTVMAIYGQTFACLPFDEFPITEAARIAISLGLGRRPRPGSPIEESTSLFWVIYCMEKDFSFNVSRSSLINDHDIACPLPSVAADGIQQINWIKTWAIFSRIASKSYDALFSLSSSLLDDETYLGRIDNVSLELDYWKKSIPAPLRPGTPIRPHKLGDSLSVTLAVKLHLYYFNMKIALSRLCLRLCRGMPSARDSSSKRTLLTAARSIIETIHYIEVEPFTPAWTLAHVPTVATFILFDFTVRNPSHPETEKNLALLNVAAGYFTRVGIHFSPASSMKHMIELINIAKEFVAGSQRKQHASLLVSESSLAAVNATDSFPESAQCSTESIGYFPHSSISTLSDFTDDVSHRLDTGFPSMDQETWSDLQSIDSLIYPVDLGLFMNSNLQPLTPQSNNVFDMASYLYPNS